MALEEADSLRFLVLELIPGDTLAERLRRGPIPFAEALELAGQIADALAAAHDAGIIHRDLKPANIKITPDGQIKVLDFGLAKALADEPADGEHSDSPTLSAHATKVGVILGTAAYMSPEQARGKPVDKRTDIFSFGIVLYEMLTGRQLFKGEDAADTMASVIRSDPDFRALPAELHPRVREVLGRCLEKDPKKRRRDIGDIRADRGEKDPHPRRKRCPLRAYRSSRLRRRIDSVCRALRSGKARSDGRSRSLSSRVSCDPTLRPPSSAFPKTARSRSPQESRVWSRVCFG